MDGFFSKYNWASFKTELTVLWEGGVLRSRIVEQFLFHRKPQCFWLLISLVIKTAALSKVLDKLKCL